MCSHCGEGCLSGTTSLKGTPFSARNRCGIAHTTIEVLYVSLIGETSLIPSRVLAGSGQSHSSVDGADGKLNIEAL